MTGNGRRFDPSELQDRGSAPMDEAEAAAMLDVARTLETFAAADGVTPSVGFEDRVMGAIALEPAPRPRAGGILAGLVLAVRDAWRVTWSSDRPMAVRAQALALVLLVVVAVGSVGTLTAVGVATFLGEDRAVPPTVQPDDGPSIAVPTPSVTVPTPAVPTGSLPPSSSPEATEEPAGSEEPSETPEATDDGGAGGTADPAGTPRPTAKPTHTASPTPDPTETAEPDDTPDPSETPDPTSTPQPTSTLRPTSTPSPTGSSDSVDPAG